MMDAIKSITKAVVILTGVGLAIGLFIAAIGVPIILIGKLFGAH